MIQANELRIGNWVALSDKAPILKECKGSPMKMQLKDFPFVDSGFYVPIPLTAEVLEKCGFEWNKGKKNLELFFVREKDEDVYANFHFSTPFNNQIRVGLYYEDGEPLKFCTALHQLQNLYFALADTELIVNF